MQLSLPVYVAHRTPAFAPLPFPLPASSLYTLSLSLSLCLSLTHTLTFKHTTHIGFFTTFFSPEDSLSLSLSLSHTHTHTHTHTEIVHTFLLNPTHTHDSVLHQQRMLKIAWPEIHPTSASLLSLLSFHPPPPPPPHLRPSCPPPHCHFQAGNHLQLSNNKGWTVICLIKWVTCNFNNTLVITDFELLLQTVWYNLMYSADKNSDS